VGDSLWVPSHVGILVWAVLLVPGLLGLARSGLLSGAARTAAWVAFGVSILWLVESVPHLLAALDQDALLAGQSAPFLYGHLVGATLVYPLIGFSVAALALLSGRTLTHPVLGVLGAVGAAAFGFAPVAVGPLGIDALGFLFTGLLLFALWTAAVGVTALIRRRSSVPQPAA
jgi:hypothetical protein